MIVSAFADEAGKSAEAQADALLRNGIDYVDIRAIGGKNVTEMSFDECEAYADYFSSRGIKVNCIGSPVGKSDIALDRSYEENRLADLLRKAEIFGTDKIRIFSFYNAREKFEEVCKRLRRLTDMADKKRVSLYHENELGIYGERAADVAALAAETEGLKFLYDPANFVLVGQNVEEAEELLLSRTDFFHVKDATYAGAIVPAGEGEGRVREALGRCRPAFVTLEPHLTEFDGYGNIDERRIKSKYAFDNEGAAFDCGARALKKLLGDL